MNKLFKTFCEGRGLTVNGNNAYGTFNGYELSFILQNLDSVSPVKIHLNCYTTDKQKMDIESALRSKSYKFFRWQFTQYGLLIGLNAMTNKGMLNRLPQIIDETCEILNNNGAKGAGFCPICGNELNADDSKPYFIENLMKVTIDNQCASELNKIIEAENADYENAPNNYGKGFLGALIGGLAGMVTAVILYLIGYVASISSLVAFALGNFLYGKFGGKKNKTMIVIVTATSLVCVLASVFAIYTVAAGVIALNSGSDLNSYQAFAYLMENEPDFSKAFYQDLGMMAFFAVLGVIFEILSLRKKIQRPNKIK